MEKDKTEGSEEDSHQQCSLSQRGEEEEQSGERNEASAGEQSNLLDDTPESSHFDINSDFKSKVIKSKTKVVPGYIEEEEEMSGSDFMDEVGDVPKELAVVEQKKAENRRKTQMADPMKISEQFKARRTTTMRPNPEFLSAKGRDSVATKASHKHKHRHVFGAPQNQSQLLNIKNDDVLLKICDWSPFEDRVLTSPKTQLPSFFINQEIQHEEWKNIPIPLTEGVGTLKRAILNLENLIISLVKEQRNKSEHIVKKFKLNEKVLEDRDINIKRSAQNDKKDNKLYVDEMRAQFRKEDETRKKNMKALQEKLRLFQEEMQRELRFCAKTNEIKNWTVDQCQELYNQFKKQVNQSNLDIQKKLANLMEENLLVPGLIGKDKETCDYRNMKEFILGQNDMLKAKFENLDQTITQKEELIFKQLRSEIEGSSLGA